MSAPTMAAFSPTLDLSLGQYASNTTLTKPPGHSDDELRNWSSLIGIVTAIVGNVLIALALNVQRYAHIRLHRERHRIKERVRQAERQAKQAAPNTSLYGALDDTSNGSPVEPLSKNSQTRHHDANGNTAGSGTRRGSEARPGPLSRSSSEESEAAPSSYLRSPYWWLGQVLITLGEMGNFLAYGFAPASIVSPLGVVALVSNCIIAPMLFKEKFRQRDFWGVVIAVGGVVVVVFSANQQEAKLDPHDVWDAITTLEFEIYLAVTVFLIVFLMWMSSTCANRTILVDLGLVGLFGGYTALATKGVSSMLSSTLWRAFTTPVTYALVFILLVTAIMQIRYLNKALQRYDSTEVIPIQFVMFTLCVIIGSAVLYRDFENTTLNQTFHFVGGCLLTFFGVFLITSGRPPRDEPEEEFYQDLDDSEEAIGLLHQDQSIPGNGGHPTSGDSVRSRRSSTRSSQSRRISITDVFAKPFTIQRDSGIPSLRAPTGGPKLSSSNDAENAASHLWAALEPDDTLPGLHSQSIREDPIMPRLSRENSATSERALMEPSTPRSAAAGPLLQYTGSEQQQPLLPQSTTPTARPYAETTRESPMLHKTSLSRIRSSIRASLYISDTDEEGDEHGRASGTRREPLFGDLTDVEEGGSSLAGERHASDDPKRRSRSLSDTLNELFNIKKKRDEEQGGDDEEEEDGGDHGVGGHR
ncbi:unnamed protein product [Parascedosporium putredinis]|uniref:DUF803-domain-containing protein n=1 Tax=Parascedosporium putredinis TaxID=1442378 RepID=A0A9P1M7M3_9PEZI|nr:unnamed protein product [Parascedosporium putredinis]CAI7988570.1 unnamed protein product [Parascedosporium putredinis]